MAQELYQADESDVNFLLTEITLASAEGFFDPQLALPEHIMSLRKNIHSIITHGQRLDEPLRAQAMMLEVNGVRVGFAIVSEISSAEGGNELYVFCVARDHRGNGYGKFLLDNIIERWSGVDFYCRCAAKANKMFRMLQNRQFEHLYTTDDGNRVLRRNKTH